MLTRIIKAIDKLKEFSTFRLRLNKSVININIVIDAKQNIVKSELFDIITISVLS